MSECKRAANITIVEKNMLIELVERYASIVENKETDKVSSQSKGQAWERIATEFNGISANKRTSEQLKQAYNNIKKNAKKAAAKQKLEIFKTGGGPVVSDAPPESLDERVLALLGNRATPLDNLFDSDAAYNANIISDVVQITTGDDLNSFSPLDSVLQSLSLPTVVDVSALLSSSQNLLPGPASTSAVAVQTSKQQQQQSTTNVSSQLQLPGPSGTTAVTIQTTSQQQPAITVISDEESSHAATSINIPKLTADSRSKSWAGRRRPRPSAVTSASAFTKIAALADCEKDYYAQKLKMDEAEHAVRMRLLLLQEQFEIKRLKTLEE